MSKSPCISTVFPFGALAPDGRCRGRQWHSRGQRFDPAYLHHVLTEIETANGYVLLKDQTHVVITATDDATRPCTIYTKDVLGVLQNDPHYQFDGGYDLHLSGIPQEAQIYNMLTASATVDGNAVQMREDNGSANAAALLKVVNNPGFDLPDTGDNGTMLLSIIGIVTMAGAAVVIFLATRKKPDTDRK